MEPLLGLVALAALSIFLGLGVSSFNLNEKDKAELAAKPPAYRALVKLSRWVCIAITVAGVLLLMKDCMGRSSRGDCDYGSHGQYCGPG